MKQTGQYPCAEYANRKEMDTIEADYWRATMYANKQEREAIAREQALEAAAIAMGMTAEQYEEMRLKGYTLV